MPLDITEVDDKAIERGHQQFKRAIKTDSGLFQPGDEFMVNHKGKLYTFTKKEIIQEWLRREELRKKQKIKDRLKELSNETKDK